MATDTNPEQTFSTRSIERKYSVTGCDDADKREGLALYAAAKWIAELGKSGRANDGTHIRRNNRCVGFYCGWLHTTRGMFGAFDDERALLNGWSF